MPRRHQRGRAHDETAQAQGDHHDVPERPASGEDWKIETVQAVIEPSVRATEALFLAQERTAARVQIEPRLRSNEGARAQHRQIARVRPVVIIHVGTVAVAERDAVQRHRLTRVATERPLIRFAEERSVRQRGSLLRRKLPREIECLILCNRGQRFAAVGIHAARSARSARREPIDRAPGEHVDANPFDVGAGPVSGRDASCREIERLQPCAPVGRRDLRHPYVHHHDPRGEPRHEEHASGNAQPPVHVDEEATTSLHTSDFTLQTSHFTLYDQRMRAPLPLLCLLIALASGRPRAEDWPQFRGPSGQGHSTERDVPLEWSESRNVRWKTPVPGRGWSSPVVSAGRVWLTTAVTERGGASLRALAFDADSGREVVNVEVFRIGSANLLNLKNSHASPTPIVDGDRVYVHFGAEGTAALTTTGDIVWKTRLPYQSQHGNGGSPVLYGGLLIVSCDGSDAAFVAALDARTGRV